MAAIVNPISPTHEYVLSDYTITALITGKGFFEIAIAGQEGQLENFEYDGKPESKMIGGSGPNPRAHTRITNKPTVTMEMAVDFATKFEKKLGPNGTCALLFTRQAPGGSSVTDRVDLWKPLFGARGGKAGDAMFVKVTGLAKLVTLDTQNAVATG